MHRLFNVSPVLFSLFATLDTNLRCLKLFGLDERQHIFCKLSTLTHLQQLSLDLNVQNVESFKKDLQELSQFKNLTDLDLRFDFDLSSFNFDNFRPMLYLTRLNLQLCSNNNYRRGSADYQFDEFCRYESFPLSFPNLIHFEFYCAKMPFNFIIYWIHQLKKLQSLRISFYSYTGDDHHARLRKLCDERKIVLKSFAR